MTPTLRDFLQAYADWAYLGKANVYDFDPYFGLCSALKQYCYHYPHLNPIEMSQDLTWLFINDGLNSKYPFGEDDYNSRADMRTGPKRRAWVLSKLEL